MDDPKRRARATYDAAATFFDEPALAFWDTYGRATIERIELRQGATVLDACAGSGASAIPAATRVGPSGKVVAVDLADNLLSLAREKAERAGLRNLETVQGDVEALEYPASSFDAVVIVFGVFFLPDMVAGTSGLWRMVAPGGMLAVTTWGPRLWEPASTAFWDAVDQVRPDLTRAYHPWDSLTDPDAVRTLLVDAGAEHVVVEAVPGSHPLRAPEDFWTIVMGSGYRATHDAMREDERAEVRTACLGAISSRGISSVETNVIFATATRSTPRRAAATVGTGT